MSILDSVIDSLAENFLRGAIAKAVNGFVAKGYITPAEAPEMQAGVMDEVQVGLKMWQAAQAKTPRPPPDGPRSV